MENTELYPVCNLGNGQLFVMPKPNPQHLNQDIEYYRQNGVTKVISLLLPEEIEKLMLADEEKVCKAQQIDFLNFSIKDMSIPALDELKALHRTLKQDLAEGHGIAIHCHGGRGRAGTVAITLMIEHGYEAQFAMDLACKARGDKMPVNDIQTEFVLSYI